VHELFLFGTLSTSCRSSNWGIFRRMRAIARRYLCRKESSFYYSPRGDYKKK
jgi:hypothetical protein